MKFKIIKYACLLALITDLIITILFNYAFCNRINDGSGLFYFASQIDVALIYIQIAISITLIMSSLVSYTMEYKYSVIFTIIYLSFITLNLTIWFIKPTKKLQENEIRISPHIDVEYFVVYPNIYTFLYCIVILTFGGIIYKKGVNIKKYPVASTN